MSLLIAHVREIAIDRVFVTVISSTTIVHNLFLHRPGLTLEHQRNGPS